MTRKMIVLAAAMSVALISEASAGSLLGGNKTSGIGSGIINVSPSINVLNGSNTGILNGVLSGNSILNAGAILSGNKTNGLLGLGILSNNNNGNTKKTR